MTVALLRRRPCAPLAALALGAALASAPDVAAQQAGALEDVWHERSLANGIRAVVVDAPDAPQQVFFTLLPWGFLAEEAGAVQQAHMVEHMLVRSLDPGPGPTADGLLINGETMALSQRLETYGPAESWQDGLFRHAHWLGLGSSPQADALARSFRPERAAVLGELDSTTAQGATHKWALAGWNQVVRHGADHVAVRAAVEDTPADELVAAIRRRLVPGPAVTVVSVGPQPAATVMEALEDHLGSLPRGEWRSSAPTLDAEAVRRVGPREATWDLDRLHYVVWYPMPAGDDPLDRAAADALAFVLTSRLQQRGGFNQLGVSAYASADLVTPEGRFLSISASAPTGTDLGKLSSLVEEVVASLRLLPEVGLLINDMATQLASWPDFADLRQRMAGRPGLDWIEAQQALFLIYAQHNTGLDVATLPAAYRQLTPERVGALADTWLTAERRSTLVLYPAP